MNKAPKDVRAPLPPVLATDTPGRRMLEKLFDLGEKAARVSATPGISREEAAKRLGLDKEPGLLKKLDLPGMLSFEHAYDSRWRECSLVFLPGKGQKDASTLMDALIERRPLEKIPDFFAARVKSPAWKEGRQVEYFLLVDGRKGVAVCARIGLAGVWEGVRWEEAKKSLDLAGKIAGEKKLDAEKNEIAVVFSDCMAAGVQRHGIAAREWVPGVTEKFCDMPGEEDSGKMSFEGLLFEIVYSQALSFLQGVSPLVPGELNPALTAKGGMERVDCEYMYQFSRTEKLDVYREGLKDFFQSFLEKGGKFDAETRKLAVEACEAALETARDKKGTILGKIEEYVELGLTEQDATKKFKERLASFDPEKMASGLLD